MFLTEFITDRHKVYDHFVSFTRLVSPELSPLQIFVPDNYPAVPPKITFRRPRIVMNAVNKSGDVDVHKLDPRFQWKPHMNIADVLKAIRDNLYQNSVIKASQGLQNTQY